MVNIVASTFLSMYAVELLILEGFFGIYLRKNKFFLLKYLLGVLFMVLAALFIPMTGDSLPSFIFSEIAIFVLSTVQMKIAYNENWKSILFIALASYTIQHIASTLNSLITMANPELFQHLNTVGHYPATLGLILICDVVVFTIAYWVIIRRMPGIEQVRVTTIKILLLSGIIVVINQIWGVMFEFYAQAGSTDWTRGSQYLWNMLCCILCLAIQFDIFQKSKVEQELDVVKQISVEKEKQFEVSKSTMDAINMKCHNLKYQLSQLEIGNNSQKALEETYELIDTFGSEIKAGNETLNIIFTEKNSYCKLHKISFVCMIDGEKLDFMEMQDIYVLFGNILDNAIHAVEKLPGTAERTIYVNVHAENSLLHISTENGYDGKIVFTDGLPETSSGDYLNHGYGMKTIRMISEKYGGSASASAKDGIFYLTILIPL